MPRLRWVALAALAVQCVLLFSNLGLLPLWGDELFTLTTIEQPLPQMFETLRLDIHPPLYYLAQRTWMRLTVGDPVVRLRALSAMFALAASAFAMWFLLPRLSPAAGVWFCLLLAMSPCLILYGRMARSYSLQLLVVLVALDRFLRLLKEPTYLRSIAFGLAASLVLYTHYAPGAAVAAGANVVLLWRRRAIGPLLLANGVMLAAYSPWIATSLTAVSKWENRSGVYRATGGAISEEFVKLGYWALSFLFGESAPWWLFFSEMVLAAALIWLACQGARRAGEWGPLLAIIACIGYLGVSRWVTYPFLPARMMFVLPFLYLLLAHGAEAKPKQGRIILSVMLATSALGLWSYFHVEYFLNWGYAVPYAEMARDINSGSEPTIVATGAMTGSNVLRYYLPQGAPFQSIRLRLGVDGAAAELASGRWKRICVVRNTHDTTADAFYARVEETLARQFPNQRMHYYRPRTRLDQILIGVLGWKVAAPYFYQMIEFER